MRELQRFAVAFLALGGFSGGVSVHAADTQGVQCHVHRPVAWVVQMASLPPVIAGDLRKRSMSDAGGPFNAIDVGQPGQRMIRAARAGHTWVVWYEQGGRVLSRKSLVYELSGRRMWLLADTDGLRGCWWLDQSR